MSRDNKKKIEPWRIIVFIIATASIVFLWVKKDIAEIYATMPKEQIVPLVITAVMVTLLKVLAITGGILLVRWIISKIKKN